MGAAVHLAPVALVFIIFMASSIFDGGIQWAPEVEASSSKSTPNSNSNSKSKHSKGFILFKNSPKIQNKNLLFR
jgi:hypothetical protein